MADSWKSICAQVKAMLMHRGFSAHESEDLVQDALVRLMDLEQHERVRHPKGFLMRAAKLLSMDAYRMSKRRGEHVLIEDVQGLLVDPAPAAEEVLLAREQKALLTQALTTMDPKTRQIFLAHRIEDRSYAAIAGEYEISVSAVEKHIAKAAWLLTRAMEGGT